MAEVTLKEINRNLLLLKKEVDTIKEILEEDLKLKDEVKAQIKESRNRPISEFKTQAQIEKKFL